MTVTETGFGYKKEPLISPFGFKGNYIDELWQTVARVGNGTNCGTGVGVLSVLWSDSAVFEENLRENGNKMMLEIAEYALELIKSRNFKNPIELLNTIFDDVYEYGRKITNRKDLRKTFVLNSLVSVDNALWQLYSAEKREKDFLKLIPQVYAPFLESRQKKLANIPLVTYNMTLEDVKKLALSGAPLLKIKIGSDPDSDKSQEKMLEWDKNRIKQIHETVKDFHTDHTDCGHICYYLDANGRYEAKDTLKKLLDFADKIGMLSRILILEEPFPEENKTDVSGLGVRIAADESAHSNYDIAERISLGYRAFALKPIAKTLSLTLEMLKTARENDIPCFCADLTVNPYMVEINKNIASRLPLFPGMKVGILESNGKQNYRNWEKMKTYDPLYKKYPSVDCVNGIFNIEESMFNTSFGIFEPLPEYEKIAEL